MTTTDFTTAHFTGIDIAGEYIIVYSQSQTASVSISMQENLFNYLNVTVENGILRVYSERSFRTDRNHTPRIYVSAPYFNTVTLAGATSAENWDTVTTDVLYIDISGVTDGVIPMQVNALEISAAGVADFTLTGIAHTTNISIAGAGKIDAQALQTADTTVAIAGGGSVDVAVSDTLDVTIAGAGTVRYVGDPQVSRSIAGVGTVRQMD
jgi:hypothetical protein